MKKIVCILLVFAMLLLFAGCTEDKKESVVCIYNGEVYRPLSELGYSDWKPLSMPTIDAKAYIGSENNQNTEPNEDIELFSEKSLNMLLSADDGFKYPEYFCREDYKFPDITNNRDDISYIEIFDIENFEDDEIHIRDKSDLSIIVKGFLSARLNEIEDAPGDDNARIYDVTLKFSTVYAEWQFGCLLVDGSDCYISEYSIDTDGDYNAAYRKMSSESAAVINKYLKMQGNNSPS